MKKILKLLAIFLCVIIVIFTGALVTVFTSSEKHEDIFYGELPEEALDIYIPKKLNKKGANGCIIFIHGGSWTGGDKADEKLRCLAIASGGYVCASINYTLFSEENAQTYTVKTVINQISMAIEKVVEYCAQHQITINKVATAGYSAGAHLSMLYSFANAQNSPVEIAFTANLAGPADFSTNAWDKNSLKVIGERLSGITITDEMFDLNIAQPILNALSPVFYVNENTVPSIFMYGAKDDLVTPQNGEALIESFEKYGVDYKYISLSNSNHMLIQNPLKHLTFFSALFNYCKIYF